MILSMRGVGCQSGMVNTRWRLRMTQTGYDPHNHAKQDDSADQDDQVGGKEGKDELVRMAKVIGG